ncbi:hypothetical protein HYC85_031920 [Camellia sinensis]|uniref:beta-galactosidase n=1 Tax=Camellia sinensis TaxID=4442 RepID=A0A7J7FSF9_CAMSI|nr:hypothetical protein HYC85_031920 [Camellia sinensis]
MGDSEIHIKCEILVLNTEKRAITQKCGLKLGLAGIQSLVVQFLSDLLKTWHFQWQGLYRIMYHGGTNFGRTTAGLFIATSYDYDAPIDEYVTWPGNNLQVHVFNSKSGCAAFLANYDTKSSATVTFQNMRYDLPPWSVSILPDCKNAVFNTARVRK